MPLFKFMSKVVNESMRARFIPSRFKCSELHPTALNIRSMLIRTTKEKFAHQPSILSSLFKVAPIESHLMDFRKFLSTEQDKYVDSLNKTCHQLILKEHLPILKKFYNAKKQENSLLGELYSQMSFEDMLCRLVQKKYQAIYLDGRLLTYRSSDQRASESFQALSDREKILAVGTPQDKGSLYKHYLTIEESALSYLVFANGYYLAVSRGIRLVENYLGNFATQKMIINELNQAHVGPILVNYIVGPELRNGKSLHYDALMCLQYDTEQHGHSHYDRRTLALQQQGFSSIAELIYGNEYPQGPKPKAECQIQEFETDGNEKVYFYVNAYKNRLKHALKQVIMAHELLSPDSSTMRLKGFGLGAFGVSSLNYFLEDLYLEVLNEVLQTTCPKKINKIELLNFPSTMNQYEMYPGDLDYYMQYSGGIKVKTNVIKYEGIEVVYLLAPSLEKTDDVYMSTQICGDSMSLAGNEATIGYPPSSSDEAAMYYALAGVNSMSEQAMLTTQELAQKIVVTDGVSANTLYGDQVDIDLSAAECGHFTEETILHTRSKLREEAVAIMNYANKVSGVLASIKKESDGWTTVITLSPGFDRQGFFGTINRPSDDTELKDNSFLTKRS